MVDTSQTSFFTNGSIYQFELSGLVVLGDFKRFSYRNNYQIIILKFLRSNVNMVSPNVGPPDPQGPWFK
jgi:hypothetical protein